MADQRSLLSTGWYAHHVYVCMHVRVCVCACVSVCVYTLQARLLGVRVRGSGW